MSDLDFSRPRFGGWKTPSCPDPLYCLELENPNGQRCRSLAQITDLAVLCEHLDKGTDKERFHAVAHPLMPLTWVLSLMNLRVSDTSLLVEPVLQATILNPKLTADNLPPLSEFARSPRLLELLVPHKDLIPDENLAEAGLHGGEQVWAHMVRSRFLPVDACEGLLRQPGLLYLKRTLVSRPDVPAEIMARILSTPSPESLVDPSATFTSEARLSQTAATNPKMPIELVLTCPAPDGRTNERLIQNAEARSEEATTWLAEHHPDLVGVPFEWVRQVLC